MGKAGKGQYDRGIIYNAGTEIATALTKSCNNKEGDGDSSDARQGGREKDKVNN